MVVKTRKKKSNVVGFIDLKARAMESFTKQMKARGVKVVPLKHKGKAVKS